MKVWVNVPEEYAAGKSLLGFAKLYADNEGFLCTGDAASDQNQESTRVDRSATEQRNGRPLDHQITCQDAGGDGLEFQQREGPVSFLLLRHAVYTMRK